MSASTPQHAVRVVAVAEGAGPTIRQAVALLADRGFRPSCCADIYGALNALLDEPHAGPSLLVGSLPTMNRRVRQLIQQISAPRDIRFCCLVSNTPAEHWLNALIEAVQDDVGLAATPHGMVDLLIRTAPLGQHNVDRPPHDGPPSRNPTQAGPIRPRDLLSPEEADAIIGGFNT